MKQQGTIIAHYGVAVDVRFTGGETAMIRVKRNSGHVVGDEVEVENQILSRLPRQTEIRRMDARHRIHVVGANLDLLCIISTCEPLPPPGFIDRAIVAARNANLRPVLLLNKSDLPCFAPYAKQVRTTFADSLPIFEISATTGENLEQFADFLADRHRGIFVGPTGVGKSSILNTLLPELTLATGEISQSKKRGRHTTTVSTLHTLRQGGELIDSPGFNDFGLVQIQPTDLARFFPGFENLQKHPCQFRNCSHRQEPGCAITTALEEGKLSRSRYITYIQLLEEVEGVAADSNYRTYRKRRKK